jgi:hypothetical protein
MPALWSKETSTPLLLPPLSKPIVYCTIVGELNCLRAFRSFSLNFLHAANSGIAGRASPR